MTDTEKMKKHITSTKRLGEVLLSPLAVITMRSRSRWRILRMDASSERLTVLGSREVRD